MATTTSLTATELLTDILTGTPTEDILVYGDGRGRIRRVTLPLEYSRASLAPLPLFQQLNADRPGVLFESVDISRIYGRYSLAVIDPPVLVEGKDDTFVSEPSTAAGGISWRGWNQDCWYGCPPDGPDHTGDSGVRASTSCRR